MLATLFSIALFAIPAFATEFTIDTPSSIQSCQPTTFHWTGGSPPYDLVIVSSDDPCGDILADLGGGLKGTSMTWPKANLSSDIIGKTVSLSLQDNNGLEAWSGAIKFVKNDTSCLTATPATASASVPVANVEATPLSAPSVAPVGAAGASKIGSLLGGAPASRQTSTSVFVVSTLTALLAFSL
ncbi:hypothetical protein PILCRDRAFT_829279 [Piloderma croceum F 1598]|uniref:Reelin domain-containing protein n=1 Tax=Piloderma croceum (strain F 1598) TaxID=765440 RepID=A0A0C3EKZ1_PILCF|nr:hypothetical protein PILCRDRAFT_829279 [Piloderma croceum F 1598]